MHDRKLIVAVQGGQAASRRCQAALAKVPLCWLVELGTHDELIARGGRYAALAEAWARSQPAPGGVAG